MLIAIVESFGICMGYVLILIITKMIWNIVVKAFTRGY